MDISVGFVLKSEDFQHTDFPKTISFNSYNAFCSSLAFWFLQSTQYSYTPHAPPLTRCVCANIDSHVHKVPTQEYHCAIVFSNTSTHSP